MNVLDQMSRRRHVPRGVNQISSGNNQLGYGPDIFNTGSSSTTYRTPVYTPPPPSTWPTTPTTPTYIPSSPSGTGNTVHYFNTIANLVSQTLSGWSRNPTNQVTSQGGVIANPAVLITQAQNQPQPYYGGGGQGYGGAISGGNNNGLLESAGTGLMAIVAAHPIPIAIGVLAVFLLFREPPRSSRR